MKRITQTKEIQTGDNSGVIFSGNEKASYSYDFSLDDFSSRDLISLEAARDLFNTTTIPTLAPWVSGSVIMEDDYRTFIIDGTEYLFRSTIDNNTTEPSLTTPDWAVIGSASQNLQSVTDGGNSTSNALQITGLSNADTSKTGTILGYAGYTIIANVNGSDITYLNMSNIGVTIEAPWANDGDTSILKFQQETPTVAGAEILSRLSILPAVNDNDATTKNQVESLISAALPSAGNQPIVVTGSSFVINWQTDVVPWDTLGRTYAAIYGNTITTISGAYANGNPNEYTGYFPNFVYTKTGALINVVTINDIFAGTITIL